MAVQFDRREHYRQISIIAYVVMLALLVPLTVFLARQENIVRSNASTTSDITGTVSPPFSGIGTCPGNVGCPSPEESPMVTDTTIPNGTEVNPTGDTANPDTTNPDTTNPCTAGDALVAASHHKKHHGGISDMMQQFLKFFLDLINKLMQLLGGSPISNPETSPGDTVSPTSTEAQPSPEQAPCPPTDQPTQQPQESPVVPSTDVPSVVPSEVLPSTVVPSQSPTGEGTDASVEITFYGAYDNDPKGSTDISDPVLHQKAGGTGTYADPLTFASPVGTGQYTVGEKIYVPLVQKYFIREDTCAVSWTAPDGCGAVTHVDLYVGNPSDSQSVLACEDALTPSGNGTIILNPPSNLTVDATPIWDQSTGKCMTAH